MNKLCCLPWTDTPEVTVKVNCVSSCCASEVKNDDDDDVVDGVSADERSVNKEKKSCCGKKRKFSKSHAKGAKKEEGKLKDE